MFGIKATLLGQLAKIMLQFLGLVLLSRLVEPRYFGFVALQITILSFLELVREWGNGTVSLQSSKSNEVINLEDRRKWFWVSLSSGIALSVGYICCLLLLLPDFSEYSFVVLILGSTLVASGVGAQHNLQLVLDKRFSSIYSIEVTAQAISLCLAIYIIYLGQPLLGLAVQYAMLIWIAALVKMLVSNFRPTKLDPTSFKSYYSRGKNLAGMATANFWNYNLDNIFISHRFGESFLGIYNRAFQLYMVPVAQFIWPLEKVILVHSESKISSAGNGPFLLRMQNQLHLVSSFAFTLLGASGYLIIPWLLGDNWNQTAQVLQILCFAGLVQVPMLISHWGFLTSGKNSGLSTIGVIRLASFALALATIGTRFEYVALSVLLANLVSWISSLIWLHRRHPAAQVRNLLLNGISLIASGSLIMGLVHFGISFIRPESRVAELALVLFTSTFLYCLAILVVGTKSQREISREILQRSILKLKKGKNE